MLGRGWLIWRLRYPIDFCTHNACNIFLKSQLADQLIKWPDAYLNFQAFRLWWLGTQVTLALTSHGGVHNFNTLYVTEDEGHLSTLHNRKQIFTENINSVLFLSSYLSLLSFFSLISSLAVNWCFERAAMLSSTYLPLPNSVFNHATTSNISKDLKNSLRVPNSSTLTTPKWILTSNSLSGGSSPPVSLSGALRTSLPLAASLSMLLWSSPVYAGFLSGSTGLESVPGPQLPQIDFLNRFNEENQKKYAEFDERFKSSPLLQKLLEQSKLNKEKNKQEIQDKYCLRGAEWGVGDCSTGGMSESERDDFIAMLKKKVDGG